MTHYLCRYIKTREYFVVKTDKDYSKYIGGGKRLSRGGPWFKVLQEVSIAS